MLSIYCCACNEPLPAPPHTQELESKGELEDGDPLNSFFKKIFAGVGGCVVWRLGGWTAWAEAPANLIALPQSVGLHLPYNGSFPSAIHLYPIASGGMGAHKEHSEKSTGAHGALHL